MPQRVVQNLRDGHRLVALAPALVVSAIALFVLPDNAGGYRLAKWGVLGAGLAVAGIGLLMRRLQAPRHWHAVTGFVALAIIFPAFSSSRMPTHWPNALTLLCGLALFWLTAFALGGDDDGQRASFTVLVATGVVCGWLVVLQLAGLRWLTDDVYTGLEFRAPSTFGNPNWAAAFLAALVPLALARAAIAERRWSFRAAAGLLALCSVATFSKNGVLTLAAGVGVFAIMSAAGCLRRVLVALGLVGFGAGTLNLFAFFTGEPWLRGRVFLWRVALHLIGEHPLTGVGLGGYVPAYGGGAAAVINGDPRAFMPLSSVDFVHNDILQLAAEGGLATTLAFVCVIAVAIGVAHCFADPLSRGAGAAIAALFVNGLTDSPLKVPTTFALLFFLWGWLASKTPRQTASSISGRVGLIVIVVLGGLQAVRFIGGDAYWTQGRDALRANLPATQLLERARTFMPEHGRSASHYARSLARDGKIDAAISASAVAAGRRFDFDDEIFRRDLQARSLDRATAIALWQELASTFPALVTPHLRLAALYLQDNDRGAAIREYETVVSSSQDTPRAEAARRQAQTVLDTVLRQR